MRYTTVPILFNLLLSSTSLAAPNEPCYGPSGIAGVCITDAACSSAGGTSISAAGQCPGPSQMKCCSSAATGFGGYSAPTIPAVGACKAVSVNAAKKVVAAFPGRIREIGCKRDCSCPGSSDHCCGLATDFMCSDGGGSATLSGKEIAEWCMKNRSALNLKYVIWGQKIWTTSVDKTEEKWENWRTMEKRDGLTQNHWDHVHVSYNG
ncbi:hypothetical protein FGSG_04239 [Fusarium graminearum PH-1]|uniref:hypothetical protein n=1 Tax=Gibberella zeae (strain ATCC MYA-4620 / CBS 123657 / FGSC 9075 / NRRL 31084 / PH-1) TaxID=229533 RepID=UPI00021F23D5|nr:hypothetical protein FGSG_04239 [Fusarium graminearum PH-1]ESU08885.1 hypothetical protein FGSG_04239 [Fusarium graminearum PH-1]EYB24770.1 hypothetical protein FG05_04239 [Fusarium graminearum]|eukprot:XP_011321384.1 hypothetical protein FGSG_04239 [Fusarium graminearum PH-1]